MRRDLQRQRGLLERHRCGTAGTGFLIGNLGALEDSRSFLVGRDHLGLRDNLTVAGLLHGGELQVQQHVVRDKRQPQAGGAAGGAQVDKRRAGCVPGRIRPFSQCLFYPSRAPVAPADQAAPPYTQGFVVIHIGLDNPRLDHYLAHRDIQLRHNAPQLFEPFPGLIGNDVVGALIHRHRASLICAALRPDHRLEQLGQVRRLGVVHLQQLPAQRRQVGDLLACLQREQLAGGQLFCWRHQQHVCGHALVQAFGLQHQVQRLIPGHVLEPQGDRALYLVTGDQIEPGHIGDLLQDGTNTDVLKVERQLLAAESANHRGADRRRQVDQVDTGRHSHDLRRRERYP
ncbi:MAG: hypothetical protein GAK37_02455 [Pseudomonas sp.]|nr:MAG: hypothetical protein GAK37_02455 [Pseudomonas sp.]